MNKIGTGKWLDNIPTDDWNRALKYLLNDTPAVIREVDEKFVLYFEDKRKPESDWLKIGETEDFGEAASIISDWEEFLNEAEDSEDIESAENEIS